MREQRWLVFGGRRKVADESDRGPLIRPIRKLLAFDDPELCEVIVFALTRKHIEIEEPERLACFQIRNSIKLEIADPFVRRLDPIELQPKNALIDVEHTFQRALVRKVDAQ